MKRTLLVLTLLLCILVQGVHAQGPLPVRVNTANARQFVLAEPQLASHFAFTKDGAALCADQAAFAAFLKFEREGGLPSSLAATVLSGQGNDNAVQSRLTELEQEITALRAAIDAGATDDVENQRVRLEQLLLEQQKTRK